MKSNPSKCDSTPKYGLGEDLIYNPEIYDAMNNFSFDVPFYLEQAKNAKGPVLELCCGTGRITLPLAKAGIDITGVDFTLPMLNQARKKARAENIGINLLKGDMRKLRLRRKFSLVFIPFNSLQNTYSLRDVERVFKTVHKHLSATGRFIFDIFNPSIHYMVKGERIRKNLYKFRLQDGCTVAIDQMCKYDPAGQVNRATWVHRINGGKAMERTLDMRCFYPLEMDALLKYNGFMVVRKLGDFEKRPFAAASMKQIYICRKSK